MGYNNNHAGMHYRRWSGVYGTFDDGREIDRDAMMKRPVNKLSQKTNNNSITKFNTDSLYVDKESDIREITLGNVFDMDNIIINIIYIALKKKIDVIHVLNKCELIMERSEFVKDLNYKLDGLRFGYPDSYKVFLFLSLVSDELKCKVSELFKDNTEKVMDFIYELLDTLSVADLELSWLDDTDLDNESFAIPCECYIPLGIKYQKYKDEGITGSSRCLYFERNIIDNEYYYSIYFGDLTLGVLKPNYYILHGSYLWEEKSGKLADFIENVVNHYKNK